MDHWIQESIRLSRKGAKKILCLHGFIGSPFDFTPLVDSLDGTYDVFIPKLDVPHGDGSNTYRQAENHMMQYKPDAIVGFSMGAAITMQLPSCIKVIIAPFHGLPYGNDVLVQTASYLSFLNLPIPKIQSGRIKSKSGKKKYKPGQWYFTSNSFLALQHLISKHRDTNITDSLLWIHAPDDPVACYKRAQKKWGAIAQHLRIENAEHVLLYEDECEKIIRAIINFLTNNFETTNTD